MHNELVISEFVYSVNKKVSSKFRSLRIALLLRPDVMAQKVGLSASTITNMENGEDLPSSETLGKMIFFFGYEYTKFYDFSEILPSRDLLRKRMKRFHEAHGSDAYEIVYTNKPFLVDIIEFRLLTTGFFDNWRTDKNVSDYCLEYTGFEYGSIPNALDSAVKKGWLELKPNFSPKSYRKKI